jgi:hypothetical protein
MKLYLSGAITHDKDYWVTFLDAAGKLRERGYEVIDPADSPAGLTWEEYMKMGIKNLMDCDGVAVLISSYFSRGSSIETKLALDLNMPVKTLERWIEEAK